MELADVFHCENPDKIVGELAVELGLPEPQLYGDLLCVLTSCDILS